MLGTTHFTNAVVQRRQLSPVAAVRLGLPATECVPPLTDWPEDLRELVGQATYMLPGGHEVDGRPIVPFEPQALERVAHDIKARGITDIAITSVFSPVDPSLERQAAAIVQHVMPDATVTLSCDIGRLGLLERENAAVMNACLRRVEARTTVQAFRQALAIVGLHAPLFLTQNDGTLISVAYAEQYPVLDLRLWTNQQYAWGSIFNGCCGCHGCYRHWWYDSGCRLPSSKVFHGRRHW